MNTDNNLKYLLIFGTICFSLIIIGTTIQKLAENPIGIDIKVTFAIDEKLLTSRE